MTEVLLIAIFTIFYSCMGLMAYAMRPCRKPIEHIPDYDTTMSFPPCTWFDSGIIEVKRNYDYADYFIEYFTANNFVDISAYREYLAVHFGKYPGGKLPDQSVIISYEGEHEQYNLNFDNGLDDRCIKYIKPCMSLLKVKKSKKAKLDIIAEAETIIKKTRRPRKQLAEVL